MHATTAKKYHDILVNWRKKVMHATHAHVSTKVNKTCLYQITPPPLKRQMAHPLNEL